MDDLTGFKKILRCETEASEPELRQSGKDILGVLRRPSDDQVEIIGESWPAMEGNRVSTNEAYSTPW